MGEQGEGSPSAAQSAPEGTCERRQGFFERLFSPFSTPADVAQPGALPGSAEADASRPDHRHGMVNLRLMRVEDVAIPKVEIIAVPDDIKKDELVGVFRDSGLTRLPVFKGTLDTPLGFVHLKDFALKHGFNGGGGRFSLRQMTRPLIFAPPSMGIGVLLQKMQSERIHMALVIDEYGGVDGLVTIEDLIEQVIGEIEDEHDAIEGAFWREEKPGVYTVKARAPLEDFEAMIGMKLSTPETDEEIDTLGGLVFVLVGRVPVRGEVIPHPSGAEFEVMDADARRVKRVRVRMPTAVADG